MRCYLSREGENQRGKALKRVPLERVVWALIGCAHVGETEKGRAAREYKERGQKVNTRRLGRVELPSTLVVFEQQFGMEGKNEAYHVARPVGMGERVGGGTGQGILPAEQRGWEVTYFSALYYYSGLGSEDDQRRVLFK